MKKLTSILLALLMALTLLPTAVFADVTLTGSGTANDPYKVTQDTIVAAFTKGGYIQLDADIDISRTGLTVAADKTVTLDLNGKRLKAQNHKEYCISVYGSLTLKDSTDTNKTGAGSGTLYSADRYTGTNGLSFGIIMVYGNFVMESGLIDTATAFADSYVEMGQFGVVLWNKDNAASVTINGGKIVSGWYAVAGNGTNITYDGNITVNGGSLVSTSDYAIYHPQKGTTAITGGIVDGAAGAVCANRGTVNITGGVLTTKGTGNTGNWSDGTGNLGKAAIYANARYDDVTLTVNGGTVNTNGGAPIIETSTDNHTPHVTVKSGTFNDPCALNFAESGANVTIKLDKDMTENVVVPAGVTATLDLNGFTLKNSAADHTITVNKDATLTIMDSKTDGTVDNKSHAKAALYNMGTVTLNGGKYTRSAENGNSKTDAGGNSFYNIVNYGTMAINDGVTVKQDGGYSSMVVNGYQNQKQTKYADTPTLTIAGGTFKGGLSTIKNDDNGNLTITGGTFENCKQACVQNHHVAAISGGTYTSTSEVASAVLNCGIKGCDAVDADKHELTISGGTFDGALVKTAGKLAVTGGTFSTSPAKYLPATGYAVTYNGTSYIVSEKKDVDEGTDDKGTSVVEIETTNKVENVAIPSAAIEEGKELTVNGTDTSATTTDKTVSVTLNAAAVNTVANEGDLTLTVTTKEAKNNANVADENKAAYTEATKSTRTTNAVVVSIDLKAGEGNVFTNGATGAYAIVTVPYKAGLKNVTVHHLGANGAVTKLGSANNADLTANNTFYYDSTSGVITMRLPHFSQYLLNGTTAGTPYRPRPVGTGTTTTTTTGKAQSPTTFDAGIAIYGVMAVSSVLGMGYMGKKKFF